MDDEGAFAARGILSRAAADGASEPRLALLDTNVLLDYVDSRRESHALARELVHSCIARGVYLVAAACSFKDMYYILCRSLKSEEKGKGLVRKLIECVPITPIDLMGYDLAPAIASSEPDFEDGIVRTIAERAKVTCIVTRDAAAFADSSVPKISPEDLLGLLA